MPVRNCCRSGRGREGGARHGAPATPTDSAHPLYKEVQILDQLRRQEPSLRYGRLYFREVSGNGQDFGHSKGLGGVLAFSRILGDREVLVVANTKPTGREPFRGFILVDPDLSRATTSRKVGYSNLRTRGTGTVEVLRQARFFEEDGRVETSEAARLFVILAPMEIQVLVPA